jgi:hypothetical protein
MLAKPELTFRRLCDYLLLKPTRDELSEAMEKSSFERLRSQEENRGFRERPEHADHFFREGQAGNWRKYLTAAQVRSIVDHHREQMARFGYVPDDVPT